MVGKKPRKKIIHTIRVHQGEEAPYDIIDGVAEALAHCVSMEYTQAKMCEYMIRLKGSYSVYHTSDLERAGLILDELEEEGLRCTLLHK